jgi:flavin-dependent dehydrogenase
MPSYDVIITGARVAGAALAIHLAQVGAQVLLIDKAIFPSDVISSAFLWPPTVSHLAQIGVLTEVEHGLPELRSWLKFSDGLAVQGIPPWLGPFSYNLAPMRIHFDHILLNRALSTGSVELWSPARVESLLYHGNSVVGVVARNGRLVRQAHADWVIGADGRHSHVAHLVGAQTLHAYSPYRAWFVAYLTNWGGNLGQVVAGMQDENWIGVTPTYDELAIASLSVPITALSEFRHRLKQEFCARLKQNYFIAERMNQAQVVGRVRGVVDLGGWLKQSVGEGWALVGDASAHMDPIAATGIGFSLIGAQRLARALTCAGAETMMRLNAYQQECNTLYRPIFEETSTPPPANSTEKHDWWYRAANDPTLVERHFVNVVQATIASFPEG